MTVTTAATPVDTRQRTIADFLDRHRSAIARAERRFEREELLPLLGELAAIGVIGGWAKPETGGAGLDYTSSGTLYEELGRGWPDLAGVALITESVATAITTSSDASVKDRYAERVLSGQLIGCVAMTEAAAGSNPRDMVARAQPRGAAWHVSGEKTWVTNGVYSDLCIFVARTGDKGFTRFLLDRQQHGYTTTAIDAIGLRGWGSSQVCVEGAEAASAHILGELHRGLDLSFDALARSRTFLAAIAVGIGQSALDAAVAHARTRVQFGKPLGAHQLIQDMIAEMATLVEASRQLVRRSLHLMDSGASSPAAAAMAKQFATESVLQVCSLGVQVHGAQGLASGHAAERHFRNARMLTVPDGTTQINRLIVARELLGISAF